MGLAFRFIHAAEPRLDEPIDGIGSPPLSAVVSVALRDASLAAFDRLVELALAEHVDLVLITGEIGARPDHGLRAAVRLRDGLKRLTDGGVRVVLAPEGDDGPDWTSIDGWPSSIIMVRPDSPPVELRSSRGLLATVAWCSTDQLPAGESGYPRIGLVPAEFAGAPPEGFDYLIWSGRRDYAVEDESPLSLSPGTLQGRGFAADEVGAKGAVLVSVDERGVFEHEFVPLAAIRFASVELVVDGVVSPSAVARSLAARLDALRSLHAGSPLMVEAVADVRGADGFPGGWPAVRDATLQLLREAAGDLEPFVWWERLRLRHRLVPAWERADRPDDFVGGVLELASALADEPSRRAGFVDNLAKSQNLQGLDQVANGDSVRQLIEQCRASVADSAELVGEAAELAVATLDGKSPSERSR